MYNAAQLGGIAVLRYIGAADEIAVDIVGQKHPAPPAEQL